MLDTIVTIIGMIAFSAIGYFVYFIAEIIIETRQASKDPVNMAMWKERERQEAERLAKFNVNN